MRIEDVSRYELYDDSKGPEMETYYVHYTDGTCHKYYSEAEMPEDAQNLIKYGNCEIRMFSDGIVEIYTDSMITAL